MENDELLLEEIKNLNKNIESIKSQIFNISATLFAIQYHKTSFAKYRNSFSGKEVVLVATGPTASRYQQIPNAVHVGVNGAIYLDNVDLDIEFVQDYPMFRDGFHQTIIEDILNYRCKNCIKFFGLYPPQMWKRGFENDNELEKIPFRFIDFHQNNVFPYILEEVALNIWASDLEIQPVGNFIGTVFSALQFILFCNPGKLYLVGCDCSSGHAYTNSNDDNRPAPHQQIWVWQKRVQPYIRKYFSNLEVEVINPVGLKGLFTDRCM